VAGSLVVGPVLDTGGDETVDDAVELVGPDGERVVLRGDHVVPPGEVERGRLAEVDGREGALLARGRHAEDPLDGPDGFFSDRATPAGADSAASTG
jgi:hypothetical protein